MFRLTSPQLPNLLILRRPLASRSLFKGGMSRACILFIKRGTAGLHYITWPRPPLPTTPLSFNQILTVLYYRRFNSPNRSGIDDAFESVRGVQAATICSAEDTL